MDAVAQQGKKYKTEQLHSDNEKIEKLEKIFKNRRNKGQFFLPDANFYNQDLIGMTKTIFDWLGFKSEDKLFIDYANDFDEMGLGEAAGVYQEVDGTHYVFLNSKKVNNTFQAGAVLAHELMHYILMGVDHFMLEPTLENEKFTDIATVYTGLGIIVTNGFEFSSGWARTLGALMFGFISVSVQSLSFGYYKPKQYARMLRDFANSFDISTEEYAGYLLPWTRHFLPTGLKTASRIKANKSDIVTFAQKAVWKQRVKQVVILLLLLPLAIVFINWRSSGSTSNIPTDVQNQLTSQKAQIDQLKSQLDSCQSDIQTKRSTVDQYDQSAVDSFNTDVANCNAIRDQYNSGVDSYNATLNQYK